MRKISILLVVLAGYVCTVVIYVGTASYRPPADADTLGYVCTGISYNLWSARVEGGLPLLSSTTKEFYGTCGEVDDTSKFDLTKTLMLTPEFILNWAIWSGLLVGIIYLFTRRNANSRD